MTHRKIQWGVSSTGTVNLPISYSISNFVALANAAYSYSMIDNGSFAISVNGISSSQIRIGWAFSANESHVNPAGIRWVSIGY